MISYRREIDGLRAVAVLLVILFHAGFSAFPGGFVGVDVFFVISGYLITSIILAEKKAGTFSLLGFYERRARRILPALFFVMAICIPFAWLWLLPSAMKDFSQSLAAVAVFGSNVLFYSESGYFAPAAELKPLLHTWSLGVEEQYYVLFPLFIMLTWRLGRRSILAFLGIAALLSLVATQWAAYHQPDAAFYLLPTRGWELAIGAFIAFRSGRARTLEFSAATREALSAAGILLIAYAAMGFDDKTPFPSLYALVPTIGAGLLIVFATPSTVVGRLLSARLLVGIGLISYSAYLWHQPLFAFANQRSTSSLHLWQMIALSIAALPLGYLTWQFVEKPFRSKSIVGRKTIFHFACLGSLFFVGFGAFGHVSNGFESYYVSQRLNADEAQAYRLLIEHTRKTTKGGGFDDEDCRFRSTRIDDKVVKRFDRCAEKYGKALVVIGDSHAINLYNIIAKTEIAPFILGVSQGGCRPHDDYAYCHYDDFDIFLKRNRDKIGVVFFHQSGAYLIKDRLGEVDSKMIFEEGEPFLFMNDNANRIVDYLNEMSEHAKVVWIGPYVEARVNFHHSEVLSRGFLMSEKSLDQFQQLEKELKRITDTPSLRFRYVSLVDLLKFKPDFLRVGNCITFRDQDHFSRCGEDIVAEILRSKANQWLPNP
ncbi:MAG TPA: acyltransferase family protein [Burkholderiales bacterium]|nr:acyltransferase family protein [Burkholderiales bacterium]